MTAGGVYDEAWWRSYVEPIADRAILSSAEIVLDAVREFMTTDEIRTAHTLIDAQWEKLGGKPKEAAA